MHMGHWNAPHTPPFNPKPMAHLWAAFPPYCLCLLGFRV